MIKKTQLKSWHIIILFIGLFMLASAGLIDLSGVMPAGREAGVDENYPLAYPMYGVLKCEARGTAEQYTLDPAKAEIIGGDVYSWDITPATNDFKVDNVVMACQIWTEPAIRVVNTLSNDIPDFEFLDVGTSSATITTNWKDRLTKNVPYKIQISCVNVHLRHENLPSTSLVTVSETWPFLQYYGPESPTGIPLGLEPSNTRYCRNQYFQDYLKEIKAYPEGNTAADNAPKNGYELPSTIYNRISGTEIITPNVDQISLEKLNQGDRLDVDEIAAIYIYGWQLMAPIPTFTDPNTGEPLLCDAINQEIRKYETVCVGDGSCYRLPTTRVDVDQTNFACSDSWCKNVYGLGTCFDADTFTCVPCGTQTEKPCTPEQGGPECDQNVDCRVTAEGSFSFGEYCDESSRTCKSIDNVEVVCCDGERKGQLTCRNNEWHEDDPGVDSCPANMCCIDDPMYFNSGTKSDEYGCASINPNLKCCRESGNSLGICAENCEVKPINWFSDILSGIGQAIAGSLGIMGDSSTWITIGWVVLGLVIFIIIILFAAKKGKGAIMGRMMQMPVNPQTMWNGMSGAANWVNPMTPGGLGVLAKKPPVRNGYSLGKGVQTYSRFRK